MYKKKSLVTSVTLALTLACCFPFQMLASAGTLDTTFNPGGTPPGTVTTTIGAFASGTEMAIQSDGKIVVVGQSSIGAAVARYNTDGTLDATFGTGGIVTTTVGTFSDFNSVAIQSDGKIVAAGFAIVSGNLQLLGVRYNIDGTLDTSFNGTGIVTLSIGGGNNDQAESVTIQQDGKIVFGGTADDGGISRFALARYNTDGTLDTTTFNSGGSQPGTVTTAIGTSPNSFINGITLQTDGKIVATGSSFDGINRFVTARYNTDGTLDTATFNSGGSQPGTITTTIGTSAISYSVAVQQDGKIVTAGRATIAGSNQFALVRYNTDGTIDNTFGIAGVVTTPIGTFAQGEDVVIQQDGKIVVAGYATVAGSSQFVVARYNSDGTLDATFGTGGIVTTAIGTSALSFGVALQQDGKIVVSGRATEGGVDKFAVARYFGDLIPTPPTPNSPPTSTPTPTVTSRACSLRLINKYGPRL